MADEKWDKALAAKTPGQAYWDIYWKIEKEPSFSMFSKEARLAFATLIADGLRVVEDA